LWEGANAKKNPLTKGEMWNDERANKRSVEKKKRGGFTGKEDGGGSESEFIPPGKGSKRRTFAPEKRLIPRPREECS